MAAILAVNRTEYATAVSKILIVPRVLFFLLLIAAPPAWGVPFAQHTTFDTIGGDGIFARDLEFFGVSDTLEFDGRADHDLNILGGPSQHSVHAFKVGDNFGFNTRLEFSARRFGEDDGDGRPLFIPTGEGSLEPIGSDLVGLTAPDRRLRIRNNDILLGGGAPGAIFDYSQPWKIEINDAIADESATTTSTLGIEHGGAGSFSVAVTRQLTSPTTATVARGFDDLFEFELSQPQNQGGVNSDARQGFFAAGGTLVVTGFLKAVRPTLEFDFLWFDNDTAVTFDQIFEFQDPNPGLGIDEGIPGGVGDLLLQGNVRTIPWDQYEIVAVVPEPPAVLMLGVGVIVLLLARRRDSNLA